MKCTRWTGLLALAASTVLAQPTGHQCDCSETVGSCEASVRVEPTDTVKGQNIGSYSANIHIQSTAPNCSRVDYYIDSTPYFTILNVGNTYTDRAWGTSPVTQQNVSEIRCRTCKMLTASISPSSAQQSQPAPSSRISGAWSQEGGVYTFSGQGDRFTGNYKAHVRSDSISITDGVISGDSFTFRIPSDYGGRMVTHQCRFVTATEATCDWQASGASNPLIALFAPKSGTETLRKQ